MLTNYTTFTLTIYDLYATRDSGTRSRPGFGYTGRFAGLNGYCSGFPRFVLCYYRMIIIACHRRRAFFVARSSVLHRRPPVPRAFAR